MQQINIIMIGIAVQLIISYFLLKYLQHQNLNALGLYPTVTHVKFIMYGILTAVIYMSILYLTMSVVTGNPYQVNPHYTLKDFFIATAYVFRAVVFEELIFRGALLYILIKRIGAARVALLSGCCFGIYHWFSWGVLGQPFPMLIAFLNTAVLGYLWALMFEKTESMYLPAALHLGYNFASMVMFSNNKSIGLQWLSKKYITDPVVPSPYIGLPLLILYFGGFHVLCYIICRICKPTAEVRIIT